jgi:hypothetical protein
MGKINSFKNELKYFKYIYVLLSEETCERLHIGENHNYALIREKDYKIHGLFTKKQLKRKEPLLNLNNLPII